MEDREKIILPPAGPTGLRSLISSKVLDILIWIMAGGLLIYQFLNVFIIIETGYQIQNTFLGFCLILTLLASLRQSKRLWPLTVLLLVVAVGSILYARFNIDAWQFRLTFATVPDMIVCVCLLVLVLEVSRRSFGWVLPLFAVAFIIYGFIGYLLPEPLRAHQYSFPHMLAHLTMTRGIFGTYLEAASSFIFLF